MNYARNEDMLGCGTAANAPAYSYIIDIQLQDSNPLIEPVTLIEAKRWLRIDLSETAEDDLILSGITSARQTIEEYLNRSLIKRTVTVAMNIAPGGAQLPYAPVIGEITSIKDSEGNDIDSGVYKLNGAVLQLEGYSQAVLTYDAGYEDGHCPANFKVGIKRLLAFDWENRGDVPATRKIGDITGLKPYRRVV